MSKTFKAEKAKDKPTFDPNKKYKWDPFDVFEFTGQQFGMIYQVITQEATIPNGAPVMLKAEAYNTIMKIFTEAVEQGIIIETEEMNDELVPTDIENDGKVKDLFNHNKNQKDNEETQEG